MEFLGNISTDETLLEYSSLIIYNLLLNNNENQKIIAGNFNNK